MSSEEQEARRIHQDIERQLSMAKKEAQRQVKLLLLGTLTPLYQFRVLQRFIEYRVLLCRVFYRYPFPRN